MRGIAALMVFFHHLCFTDLKPEQWGRGVRILYTFSSAGMRGVDLFFILSGFLITSLLIKDRASPAYYHDFYWKRALRILPLYLLCLLGIAVLVPHSGREVLVSLLFLANFAHSFGIDANGPFWSLAIEEQFYLLWPTVVRRRSVGELARWALAIGLGAMVLRTMAAYFVHFNYHITFMNCDGLAFGAVLACWYERRDASIPAERKRESRLIALIAASGLACLAARFALPDTPRGLAYNADLYQTGVVLFGGSIIAFVIAHSGSPLVAVFRSRLLIFFGLISYAMYMTHIYVLMAYTHLRGEVPGGDIAALALRFFIVFGTTIALCLATRYLVELPAISLRRFVLSKPAPRAEIEAPLLAD